MLSVSVLLPYNHKNDDFQFTRAQLIDSACLNPCGIFIYQKNRTLFARSPESRVLNRNQSFDSRELHSKRETVVPK
jgi:hypothetical protein